MKVLPVSKFIIPSTSSRNNENSKSNFESFSLPILKKSNIENLRAYNQNITFTANFSSFEKLAVSSKSPLYEKLIFRENPIVSGVKDYRDTFDIDSDRILNSAAYAKMRFKTQVFSNPKNDFISSRLTHVQQVASVAQEISEHFGLNAKLTRAIALGHDVGHAPFGHEGERILNEIAQKEGLGFTFWHEKNSLRFVDDIETQINQKGNIENLNLTYAVRDGIVSHCGEIDENGLKPRSEYLDLRKVEKGDRIKPFTWEGCAMRVSDKIAYIGKDIEDALKLGFLAPEKLEILRLSVKKETGINFKSINNSILIKYFLSDLFRNSSPENGLTFSKKTYKMMTMIKNFEYKEIYKPRDDIQKEYLDLIINRIYKSLEKVYEGKNTIKNLDKMGKFQTKLAGEFKEWLEKYSNLGEKRAKNDLTKPIYAIENEKEYKRSIIEFLASMTDRHAVESFESIVFPY